MDQPDDMWAWAHEQPDETPPQVDASDVLAVLVTHNGEQWLPRTLVALARLDAQPGRLIGVDAGSTDGSRELLDKGLADGLVHQVLTGAADEGFGANVQQAVAAATDGDFKPRFLWLLHDDSAPSRHALTELLLSSQQAGEDGRRPAILVPKLLHPKRRNHPDQMSAVGESIAPSGARVLTVEPGDIDQHQLEPARVLGASTAGMFITMDAWQALDGFDPSVPLFRDGVDLGWRANAKGMLVRTCPKASLRHVEAGRVGLRDSQLAPDSVQADHAAGMAVVVMHARNPASKIARLSIQSLFTAFGLLLGKSPRLAAGQLRAARQVRQDRSHLIEVAQKFSEEGADEVPEGLLPARGWGMRRFIDRVAGTVIDQYYDLVDEDGGMIDELTGDDFAGSQRRARFWSPAIIGALVMLVLSLVASRSLMRFGLLSGPALLPAPDTLGQAWANWAQSAPGMAGSNAPWLGLMALGSTATFGQPDWFATLVVLGGPALAAWTAFHFLRPIMGHGWWTPILACLWGVLLPLIGVTGAGSIDLTVLAIVLPLIGLLMQRWLTGPTSGAEGWRAPAGIALLAGVLAGSMPWFWLVAAIAAGYAGWRRRDLRGALMTAGGSALWLLPWLPRLFSDPGRLLVGADPATRPAGTAPGALQILTGSAQLPGAFSFFAILAIGLLLVVGVLGASRARGLAGPERIGLLVLAFAPPVMAVLVTRLVVTVADIGVRPDPNGWLLIGLFGLLLLAAHGIGRRPERTVDDSPDDLAGRATVVRTRRILGGLLAVALALGMAWWVIGATQPLDRGGESLPTYVTGGEASDRATRTLMVDLSSGTARFNLASATSPAWGSAEVPLLSSDTGETAHDELWQAAQQIAQGQPSDDLAERLGRLGVGHVWLRGSTLEAANALSSTPQLDMAPADDQTVVFTVTSQPSRAMLRVADGEQPIHDRQVAQADADGLIVLSEPQDPNWRAWIDGVELVPADSGDWRQAWASGGRTGELGYRLGTDGFAVVWSVFIGLVLLVLTAPTAQKAHSPRRAIASSRKGGMK